MEEFVDSYIGEKECTLFYFAPPTFTLPKNIEKEKRDDPILITNERIYSFSYYGIIQNKEGTYFALPKNKYEKINTLPTLNRNNALSLVRKIALGLENREKSFFSNYDVFPLYRILIVDGENILLLPMDMSNLISMAMEREEKDSSVLYLLKDGIEKNYYLTFEMAELLYYSLTGIYPYRDGKTKLPSFIPLEYFNTSLSNEDIIKIENLLKKNVSSQRKECGNLSGSENLSIFLKESENIKWNEKISSPSLVKNEITKCKEENKELFKKLEKKAKRNEFWRRNFLSIVISFMLIILVLTFSFNYIYNAFIKAPNTRGLSKEEIVESYYSALSSLDFSKMNDAFKKKSSQSQNVEEMKILDDIRLTYSGENEYVNVEEWKMNNFPPLKSGQKVYGALLKNINENENILSCNIELYTPEPIDNEDGDDGDFVYVYDAIQNFYFTYNKRGWWEIEKDEIVEYSLISKRKLEYTTAR